MHRKVTKSEAENDFNFTDMNHFIEEKNQIIKVLKSDVIMTELENVNERLRDENIQLIKEV